MVQPAQFSLRSLLAGVAAVAVLLSVGQVAGGEAALLVAGFLLTGALVVTLCRASDIQLVPAGLCGLLVAWLIGFPPLILDSVAIDLWMGTVVVAVFWESVAPGRGSRTAIDAPCDISRRRQHDVPARVALPVLVRWMAFAMLGISIVLLLLVCWLTTTTPFWGVAHRAWQEYWWYYPVPLTARLQNLLCSLLRGTWFAYLPLVAALVPAIRLRRRPADGPEAKILMGQVTGAQSLSLMALAVIVLDAFQNSFGVMSLPVRARWHYFPAFFYVVFAIPSLFLVHVALLVVLGRRALPYIRRYGWLLALGCGAVAAAAALFLAAGMAGFPELR